MPRSLLLVLACLAAFLFSSGATPALAQTLRITDAQAIDWRGDAPAPADAAGRALKLPDDWALNPPADGHSRWYRARFTGFGAALRGELTALYVERACSNLEVWVNGRLVHAGGRMREPLTHNCSHPQLVALPHALLVDGTNVLDLRVVGHPLERVGSRSRAGGLSELEIGPQSELATQHARRTAVFVSLPQAFGAALVLTGGFLFVLGFTNRRESHLAYFGALAIGWALIDVRLWLRTVPVSHAVAEFLVSALLPFLVLAAVQFLLRLARWRSRAVDRVLLAQCAAMPLLLMAAGPGRVQAVTALCGALLGLQLLGAAVFSLRTIARQRGGRLPWALALLVAAPLAAVAFELIATARGAPPLVPQLAHLVPPLVFVLVGLRLVQLHGRALQDAEMTKAVLEQRVREATAEIEHNFRQLAELKVEQVTERERKRIAADLHDDLGAKLLTIVHTSESDRISTLAREALEEMRLSVRGLTGRPVRLADALGDWRAEVINRLAQAGIEGEWIADDDLPQTLSARAFVQTTRILREATSNIIKHSGATHCSITCRVADGDFQLVVQDDGQGIPMEADGRLDRGHGMASMKQRAKQLQGQCLVESGPGWGTVIRLTIPLDRAIETAADAPMTR